MGRNPYPGGGSSSARPTMLWRTTPAGPDPPELLHGVVETPEGVRTKYELAKEFPGVFLDRILHGSLRFPTDYGLIPRTWAEDGDPLDLLVLGSEATHPGCVVRVRPVGLLDMVDRGDPDRKVLGALTDDPRLDGVAGIDDVGDETLEEIQAFFEDYKRLELGREAVEARGWAGRETALEVVEDARDRYERKEPPD